MITGTHLVSTPSLLLAGPLWPRGSTHLAMPLGWQPVSPGVVVVGLWGKISSLLPRAERQQLPCPGRRRLSPPLPRGFHFLCPGQDITFTMSGFFFFPFFFKHILHARTHARVCWEGGGKKHPNSVKQSEVRRERQAQTEAPFIARAGRPGQLPTQMRADPNPRTASHAPAGGPAAPRWRHAAFLLTRWNRRHTETPRGHGASAWRGVSRRLCITALHQAARPASE